MGCGNGVMALSLVHDLLQARPNSKVLFVPAEIVTYCFYPGLQKDYMVANAIFRMGGAAILLSNQARYYSTAKYELLHNVRAHTGQDDASYNCMGWGPDAKGINGVYLRKDVPVQAARALEVCVRRLAPSIITWGQYAEAARNLFERRVLGWQVPEYIPDFTKCIDHFALHAGGYAVLKGLMAAMRLPTEKMLPSFATLRDYGNTSCSTTWYVLAYMETCQGIGRGQTVMQIGMGGGMKVGMGRERQLWYLGGAAMRTQRKGPHAQKMLRRLASRCGSAAAGTMCGTQPHAARPSAALALAMLTCPPAATPRPRLASTCGARCGRCGTSTPRGATSHTHP
jgi:3-ketoacyl-CoA synthase